MDVMKIARERREAMVDQISDLKTEIAKIDEFMELAEEIASGKSVTKQTEVKETGSDSKVAEFNANIFSAPAEDARAS